MIAPIYLDLIMSASAIVAALYVVYKNMRVLDDDVYTPILELSIVCAGSLGWSAFALLALSAITAYPPLHSAGYMGHWGYTSARFFAFVAWLLTLLMIRRYSAYMLVRKTPCNK